jgi:D-glycero-alpha-D-manno-heptose-7-phosphate kinase
MNDIGGWTDTWFSGEGKVLNLAISPPAGVRIKVFENTNKIKERVKIIAEDSEDTITVDPDNPDYDKHIFLQGALNSLPVPENIRLEIEVFSCFPPGSSVGTSASVCVALLGALDVLTPHRHSFEEIASLAHRVETEKLGKQSGIQDQICASYGGVCFIHMTQYPEAVVRKLSLNKTVKKELNQRFYLIYLGQSHSSSALHETVISSLEKGSRQFAEIRKMSDLAEKAKDYLDRGDLESYGESMVKNNECQRALHSDLISEEADAVIKIAKKYEALGWKVNGAGGKGGSLTLLSSGNSELRMQMLKEIHKLGRGIRHIPSYLSDNGLVVKDKEPGNLSCPP